MLCKTLGIEYPIKNHYFSISNRTSLRAIKYANEKPKSNLNRLLQHWIFAIAFIVLIVAVNGFIYLKRHDRNFISKEKRRELTTGLGHNFAREFVYFYYYTNRFPIAISDFNPEYSKEAATKYLTDSTESMLMEYKHWVRYGNHARILCYMPNAIVRGSPENPSVNLFNSIVFVTSLILLFLGFRKAGKPVLAIIIILLVNSSSFYQYEIFLNNNIFGLAACVFMMLTGILAPYIFGRRADKISLLLVILTGVIIAFFGSVRGEISVIVISGILILITINANWLKRLLHIGLLLGTFFVTQLLIESYFSNKYRETHSFLTENGGHPYNGLTTGNHPFWHPMFCGLGDFDEKYGYVWHDTVAYNYALPILNKEYGYDFQFNGKYQLDQYYDNEKKYYRKLDEMPEYEEICKKKILSDIADDPLWFIEILIKRCGRILSHTLPFPYAGFLIIPLLIVLIVSKNRNYLILLLSSLPLSLTSFAIFSGGNNTFISFFPILSIAISICILYTKITDWKIKNKY